MKVVLGAFTTSCVESWLGSDLHTGVQLAARHFGRRVRSARPPSPLPPERLLALGPDRPTVEIEVEIDPDDRVALEAEATRSGRDLQEVLTHAVLVYLADLDGGRRDCGGRERRQFPLRRS